MRRRAAWRRRKGAEFCGGGQGAPFGTANLQSDTLSELFPTMSPDSVDGNWDKASILRRPGLLLVLFQATALRHRPFCMERTKTAAGERRMERVRGGRGGEAREAGEGRCVEKSGRRLFEGPKLLSIPHLPQQPSPPLPHTPHPNPSYCCSFLSLDGTRPVPKNLLHCSATPNLWHCEKIWSIMPLRPGKTRRRLLTFWPSPFPVSFLVYKVW